MTGYAELNDGVIGAWILFAGVWLVSAFFTKRAARPATVRDIATQRILLGGVYVLLFLGKLRLGVLDEPFLPASTLTALAGLALTVLGIAGAFWARFHLGRNWSSDPSVKQGHELIETGPYGVVRHPIYSGMLLAFLGTAIAHVELRGLVAVAVGLTAFFLKARVEERLMIGEFGAAYRDYMRRVKMLIPSVL
jgi:protein-S-isoprenylcysteine O-methyltransferase Ste14